VVALAAHDDRGAVLLEHRLPGEVHPEVVLGLLLQIGVPGVVVEDRRGVLFHAHDRYRVPQS
jgi:hypothetical protein